VLEVNNVLAAQRQTAILLRVRERGGVRVRDLVHEFRVSDMTIRRDLEVLADQGLLVKVHGGATALLPHATEELAFDVKATQRQREKAAIAAHAATLVKPETAIAISAGTTAWTLAQRLVDVRELTVVTNSVPVADVFHRAGRRDQSVILTGGIRTPSEALVGPVAVAAIQSLNLEQTFLGVHGLSVSRGLMTPNLMEAEIDRALLQVAQQRIVLADHTKWELVGFSTIVPLGDVDVLITDDGLEREAQAEVAAEVGELIVVPTA
jgi:DeoR/GlpR family transcriptional regulator of sugar metabolism